MGERRSNVDERARDLIRAVRAGEPGALDRLLALHRNYLGMLARTSLDPAVQAKVDPSDAVQEALLKAYRGFDGFRGETGREFAGWLRRILANSLKNLERHYRRQGRRVDLERSLDRSSRALHELVPAPGPTPSREAARRELGVLVADALAELSADDRDVLVLRTLQGLEWNDVGHYMQRMPDAARALWGRALRRLGALLEEREWLSR